MIILTFEEAQETLTQLIDDLPDEIFKGLNCGVALVPDVLFDENGLLILGQYHVDPNGLGRYVTINYGSLMHNYGFLPAEAFREKIKEVLNHELVHHLENMAGDRSLEIEDAINKRRYLGY